MDRYSLRNNPLPYPIYGRFVRLQVRGWRSHISMRLELYGCPWSKFYNSFQWKVWYRCREKHVVTSVNVRNRVDEIGRESMNIIECFHMTSRRPYWCLKTMKRRPCWCPKLILWELDSFPMRKLSFVPINLHR